MMLVTKIDIIKINVKKSLKTNFSSNNFHVLNYSKYKRSAYQKHFPTQFMP